MGVLRCHLPVHPDCFPLTLQKVCILADSLIHLKIQGAHRLVARAIRNAIRANRFARIIRNCNPHFDSTSGRFARITRISDSRESPDSRESCEFPIRANHATKVPTDYSFSCNLPHSLASQELSGHNSLFFVHVQPCFCRLLGFHSRFLSATRTPNSHNHFYVDYSPSKLTGERFTNHSDHIHIFTPITRIVVTKV